MPADDISDKNRLSPICAVDILPGLGMKVIKETTAVAR